jgi:hypothetical protein
LYANGGYMGVYAYSGRTSGTSYGVYSRSNSTSGIGVYGYAYAATGYTYGVYGYSRSSTGTGVYGYAAYRGVVGYSSRSSGTGYGVYGYARSTSGRGVWGYAVASTGVTYGVYGYSRSSSGRGVFGYAPFLGVYGYAYGTSGRGVYGYCSSPSGYAIYAAGRMHVTGNFTASGSKSAVVELKNGEGITLYAEEASENWFVDYGSANLKDGKAVVKIDPVFAQTVNTKLDYHVFLTPEGDCKGLYVIQEGENSFVVRELNGGKSNIAFSYRVAAKRKGFESQRLARIAKNEMAAMRAPIAEKNDNKEVAVLPDRQSASIAN